MVLGQIPKTGIPVPFGAKERYTLGLQVQLTRDTRQALCVIGHICHAWYLALEFINTIRIILWYHVTQNIINEIYVEQTSPAYHAACKVEYQPLSRSKSQLTYLKQFYSTTLLGDNPSYDTSWSGHQQMLIRSAFLHSFDHILTRKLGHHDSWSRSAFAHGRIPRIRDDFVEKCRVEWIPSRMGDISILLTVHTTLRKLCTADDADSRCEHSSRHGKTIDILPSPNPLSI